MNPEDDPMMAEILKAEAAVEGDIVVVDTNGPTPKVQVISQEDFRRLRLAASASIIQGIMGSMPTRKFLPPQKAIVETPARPSGCRGPRSEKKFSKRIEEKFLAARRKKLGLYPQS